MGELKIIDVSALKTNCQQLDNGISKYKNKSYQTFKSSYINNCYDSIIHKMSVKLNTSYLELDRAYDNISKWFNSYVTNVESLEKRLSGGSGVVDDTSTNGSLISLPNLSTDINNYSGNSITNLGCKPINIDFEGNTQDVFKMIGTGAVSLVDGIFHGLEGIIETTFIGFGCIISLVTVPADMITGGNSTKETWESIADIIKSNDFSDMFDDFYQNTDAGKYLKSTSTFNATRGACKELGKALVIDGLMMLGFPVVGAVMLVNVGNNTESSWKEGQSIEEGLISGIIESGESAIVWKALGLVGKLKDPYHKVLGTMGVTMADGIADPLTKSLYAKQYTDPKTNKTYEFENSISPQDKFNVLYENNGGDIGLLKGMLFAPLITAIGDFDVNKFIKAAIKSPFKVVEKDSKNNAAVEDVSNTTKKLKSKNVIKEEVEVKKLDNSENLKSILYQSNDNKKIPDIMKSNMNN